MKIEKEYNIKHLSNILKTKIAEYQVKPSFKTISLDILTAQEIVDVLEVVASWENKRTESNDVTKEELEDNRNCFGYCVEDDYICTHCADYEKCKKETDKIKSSENKAEVNIKPERNSCFGFHVSGCGKCNLCVYEKECKEKTEIVKMMKQRVLCNEET